MDNSTTTKQTRVWIWGLLVFVVAAVLRVIYLWQFQSSLLFSNHIMDMAYHHQWAQAISQGREFIDGPFFRAPLYPTLLGAVYWLFGDGPWAPRVFQTFFGCLSSVLMFFIGRRLFGQVTGVVAGLIAASCGTMIFYEGQLLIPSLAIFLNLCSLFFLIRAEDEPDRWQNLAIGGLFLGLSAIARPTVLLFALMYAIWLMLRCNRQLLGAQIKRVLLFSVALMIPILPVTIHNYVESGELTLIGTYSGLNMFIGNNSQSDGVSAKLPEARRDWWGMMEDAERMAEQDVGHQLSPAEQSDYWMARTFDEIGDDPGRFVSHIGRKFALLLFGFELPNNMDLYYFAHQAPVLRLLLWRSVAFYPWGIILPLAALGFAVVTWRDRRLQILALFLAAYTIATVLFFVTARYRLPILPLLVVFAATGVVGVVRNWSVFSRIRKTLAVSVFCLLLFVCNVDLLGIGGSSSAQGYHATATIYSRLGRTAEAEKFYRKALSEVSILPESLNDLAMLVASRGKIDEAIELLERGVEHHPDNAVLAYNLATKYNARGKYEQAIVIFRQIVGANPLHVDALNNLGYSWMHLGQIDSSVAAYRRSIVADPEFADGYYNLGVALARQGRGDSAIAHLQRALELNPAKLGAHFGLGMHFLETGSVDRAVEHFEAFRGLADPGNGQLERVRFLLDSLGK